MFDPISYSSGDRLIDVLDIELVRLAQAMFVNRLARKAEKLRVKDIGQLRTYPPLERSRRMNGRRSLVSPPIRRTVETVLAETTSANTASGDPFWGPDEKRMRWPCHRVFLKLRTACVPESRDGGYLSVFSKYAPLTLNCFKLPFEPSDHTWRGDLLVNRACEIASATCHVYERNAARSHYAGTERS